MDETGENMLRLHIDPRVHLKFHGATIASGAGLLACREHDDALGLTEAALEPLHESRGGRNVQHGLVPIVSQSVYSRLAGYEDTNNTELLAQDPALFCVGYGPEPWPMPRRPVEVISSREG